MVVIELDNCLSQFWATFFFGLVLLGFLTAASFLLLSLRARNRRNAFAQEEITGAVYKKAHTAISRNAIGCVVSLAVTVVISVWYFDFFLIDYTCTPESIFWRDRS